MEKKKVSRRDLVARRIQPLLARLPARKPVEGVQVLNPGYFTLERIRTEARPKARAVVRQKLKVGRR